MQFMAYENTLITQHLNNTFRGEKINWMTGINNNEILKHWLGMT